MKLEIAIQSKLTNLHEISKRLISFEEIILLSASQGEIYLLLEVDFKWPGDLTCDYRIDALREMESFVPDIMDRLPYELKDQIMERRTLSENREKAIDEFYEKRDALQETLRALLA